MITNSDMLVTIELLEKFPHLAQIIAELINIAHEKKYGSLTVSFQAGTMSHFEIRTTHKIGNH